MGSYQAGSQCRRRAACPELARTSRLMQRPALQPHPTNLPTGGGAGAHRLSSQSHGAHQPAGAAPARHWGAARGPGHPGPVLHLRAQSAGRGGWLGEARAVGPHNAGCGGWLGTPRAGQACRQGMRACHAAAAAAKHAQLSVRCPAPQPLARSGSPCAPPVPNPPGPQVCDVLRPDGEAVVLIKPQFEAGKEQVGWVEGRSVCEQQKAPGASSRRHNHVSCSGGACLLVAGRHAPASARRAAAHAPMLVPVRRRAHLLPCPSAAAGQHGRRGAGPRRAPPGMMGG